MFSIITPVKNGGGLLAETAESVAAQAYRDFEWIIVDDHSSEDISAVVEKIKADHPAVSITLLVNKGQGACAARNTGFFASTGEWVTFLDGDDLLTPDFFAQFNQLAAPEVSMLVAPYQVLHEDRKTMRERAIPLAPHTKNDPLGANLSAAMIWHSACMFRREFVERIGGWDESVKADQDGDFLFRLLVEHPPIAFGDHPTFIYRQHTRGSRISKSLDRDKIESRRRVVENMEKTLAEKGLLDQYRNNLAQRYDCIARRIVLAEPAIAKELMDRAYALNPTYKPTGRWQYQLARKFLGLKGTERLRRSVEKILT